MTTAARPRIDRRTTAGSGIRTAEGFTLAEMMVGVVMFGLLGFTTTQLVMRRTPSSPPAPGVAVARQGVRAAIERIAMDIRIVGQGQNFYDLQVPDMIVPNDGTVSVNTFRNDAISLIAIPDPTDPSNQLALSTAVAGNGSVGDTKVTVAAGASLAGLASGERLILFDPNTANSQVVAITGISGREIHFTGDALIYPFSATGATPSMAIKLNEVRYRIRTIAGVPFLERKVNRGAWMRFIEGISDLRFTYRDAGGNAITPGTQAARRSIQRVEVEAEGVELRLGTPTERRARIELTTSAEPRRRHR